MTKILAVLMLAYCVFLVVLAWPLHNPVEAQSTPLTIVAQLAHTSCPVATVGKTQYCFAIDGLWQSLNGAAYTQLGAGTGGVASLNGKTGALTITAVSTAPVITAGSSAPTVTVAVN